MSIEIKPATPDDVQGILEIVNHAILHTTANYNSEAQLYGEQLHWFEKKSAANEPVLCAFADGKLAGYATYGSFREKYGYRFTAEHSVYVAPGLEGRGIGTKLMSQLIQTAKQNGIHSLIGGVDADNLESVNFHKRLGFTECGCIPQAAWKFERWLDLLFVQLILD